MKFFSLKMRASQNINGIDNHISGAEKIVKEEDIAYYGEKLLKRALNHSKGKPDFINLKVEEINKKDILYLDALPVSTIKTSSPEEGKQVIINLLKKLNIKNGEEIFSIFQSSYNMRGAILLDVDNLKRLEKDKNRGIRVTYMDSEKNDGYCLEEKNHFKEALTLATKTANAPNIIAEICMSDDPDYLTGYIASKKFGYIRITVMKKFNDKNGGRIFLYQGNSNEINQCINYLEKQKVIVRNLPNLFNNVDKDPLKLIKEKLISLKENNLYRHLTSISSTKNSYVEIDNQKMILLASNNYLGLANDERLKKASIEAIKIFGTGTGGSRLCTGNFTIHEQLEKLLSKFKEMPATLLYNTGYMANLGAISALANEGDVIFSDELNHASIIDGCRLSKAKTIIYRHNDMNDLEEKIKNTSFNHGLIVSDGVFSMDGDIANMPQIVKLAKKYHLLSMIDEAHCTGIIGKTGHGIIEYFNYIEKPDIIMGTLSKALGSEGGFISSSNEIIEYLKNCSRSFIFSTSISPSNVASAICALEILQNNPSLVQKLNDNINFFCKSLKEHNIEVNTSSAIIPIMVYDEEKANKIANDLFKKGILLSSIRYPTVKKGMARLRATIMATHNKEDLKKSAQLIAEAINNKKST